MKTKEKIQRVNIITLGCAKNRVDSEVLLTQLRANAIEAEHETHKKCDIVIINTCGFIDKAKEESIQAIVEYAEKKKKGKIEKLYVTGCLSERYKNELAQELPEVDAFFGTMELPALLQKFQANYKKELIGERQITTDSHYAYLKISEGCNRPCSFCAIPLMRGKHVSRSMDSLVQEAKFLVSKGVKELILIAQDLTFYGLDLYKKRKLADLLYKLSDIPGLEWIRLLYAYPAGFPLDILKPMQERSNICKYLDMPLQHASNKILTSMKRGITKEKTLDLLQTIREKVPDIALRTTFIVGYPGETENDFEELCDFVQQVKFDRVGVFTYSHEENTAAYALNDDVPEEIKEQRKADLMYLQQEISWQKNQNHVGKVLKILIDRKEGNYFIGRTEYDSPEVDNEVVIDATDLKIGEFYFVQIEKAEEFDLFGKVIPK